jgi:hypothetical protein
MNIGQSLDKWTINSNMVNLILLTLHKQLYSHGLNTYTHTPMSSRPFLSVGYFSCDFKPFETFHFYFHKVRSTKQFYKDSFQEEK